MRWRQARGFTLLEMLVALMLTALVVMLLGALAGLSGRQRAQVGAGADALSEVAAVQRILRQAIERSLPLMLPGENATGFVSFDGAAARLVLMEPVPTPDGQAVLLHRTEIAFERGADGLRLVLATAAPGQPARSSLLLTGLDTGRFLYFGPPGIGQRPVWLPTWRLRDESPRLVRVEIRFPVGDKRIWPGLDSAPRVRGDGSCEFDLLSGRCRTPPP